MDQIVELYRLKDKVSELEKMEQSLRTKMTRMENTLKEKANENKLLRGLVTFYKRENAKQKDNCDNQSFEVINLFGNIITLFIIVTIQCCKKVKYQDSY